MRPDRRVWDEPAELEVAEGREGALDFGCAVGRIARGRVEATVERPGGRVVADDPYEHDDVPTPSTLYVAEA